MIKTNEEFAAINKAAIESLLTIAETSLNNVERLAALNLNTARAFFADAVANFGALAAVKDPQELIALQSAQAKPAVEKAVAYSRGVYEILSNSANGLSQIVEGQTAELKKSFSTAIEQSLKNAPAGSETVVAAVKSVLAQADSAYETMSQSSQQAKAMIETAVVSANAAAAKLMKAA
ncbi:MAG: phasin family protein [Rhodocyclaceae bacterium]|nr:phasin family protein [Rhodocyclaceae bacterium]